MNAIIPRIDRKVIEAELTADKFIRPSNNGNNEIYIVTSNDSPNIMREIGRVRELTFRYAGGGTGQPVDIDDFDLGPDCYKQLIVWNPVEKDIVGGYRFIKCKDAARDSAGKLILATTELFRFSEKFIDEYAPYTIELGRSFVQPKYQPSVDNRKGLFSLDNLWDGLGAIIIDNPDQKYFFGKVTMYTHYNRIARDMILSFMNYIFPDNDELLRPVNPLKIENDMIPFLNEINGLSYKDAHRILTQKVRSLGENIPPLVNAYMNLSPTMKTFGTSMNHHFGDVEETGILVTINDIYESKVERHIKTYQPVKK